MNMPAAEPAGTSWLIISARVSWISSATNGLFGGRNNTAEFEPVLAAGNRREFPVRKMRGENECGLVVGVEADEARDIEGFHAAGVRASIVVIPQLVEMDELAGHASEIFPASFQDLLTFRLRLFWKCQTQVCASGTARR